MKVLVIEEGINDVSQFEGDISCCVCQPYHIGNAPASETLAVLMTEENKRMSHEIDGTLVTILKGDRLPVFVYMFDNQQSREVCRKRFKAKYFHSCPEFGLIDYPEFLGRHRLFFKRWIRLYDKTDLTDYQRTTYEILGQIQWATVPNDLAKSVKLIPNAITPTEEAILLSYIESQPWTSHLKRRVQHYGHPFLYERLYIDVRKDQVPPIPPLILDIVLPQLKKVIDWDPDQLTVNEYLPGQGIGFHVDTHSAFNNGICVVSLGAAVDMTFRQDKQEYSFRAHPRSVLLFENESRYNWLHGIKSRKTDFDHISGEPIPREQPRISLTFRRLNWDNDFKCNCEFPSLCDTQNPMSLTLPDRVTG